MTAVYKAPEINVRERLNEVECLKPIPDDIIVSNVALVENSNVISNVISMTQVDYDSLGEYDNETLYVING